MKKIGKKIFPIFFVLLITSLVAKGQKNTAGAGLHEFGAGIGGINYTGDLSPNYNLSNYRPGIMAFYRYNISPVVNLRFSILGGAIGANESKSKDPVPATRKLSFSSPLVEFGGSIEYNFLNYRPKKEVYRFSPYFSGGLSFFNSQKAGGFQAAIPLGMGIKYRLSKRLNLGFEFIARKTFTDMLDGVESANIGVHQTVNPFDKDWYFFSGFTISWTSFSVVCPDSFNQ